MPGEEEVRLDFSAREQITRAILRINEALGELQRETIETGAALPSAAAGGEILEEQIEETSDEIQEAMVSIHGLQSSLAGLDAQAATTGVHIPVDVDDPKNTDIEEVRQKVLAKLRENPPELNLPPRVDRKELIDELKEADEHTIINKPIADIGIDLEEDALIRQLRRAEKIAEEGGDDVDVAAALEEGSAVEISKDVRAAITGAEGSSGQVDLSLNLPDGQETYAMLEVGKATTAVEDSKASVVNLSLRVPTGQETYAILEVGKVTSAVEATTANNVDIKFNIEATDDVLELFALAGSLSAVQAQALVTAGSVSKLSNEIDDTGDEARESAAELTGFAAIANAVSLNTTALSLNVGAFNIALANLATQIPMLIGLLGTLLTAIMGVAGALALAAGGIGAFIAAGAISEITRIEEQFSNIEDSAQAMQAIMRSLADAFREAISPLTSMDESAQIFYGTINNLLTTVSIFSQAIADSLRFSDQQMQNFIATGQQLGIIDEHASDMEAADSIMSLGEFMDEVSSIISENADDIIASFKIMSAFLLPVLTSIIDYFVSGFDDMILFTTKFTTELAKLGPVFASMIDFAVQLIDLTSSILQGLLPIFIGLISIATELATALNTLNNDIVRNAAGIIGLTFVLWKLHGAYTGLISIITTAMTVRQLELLQMEKKAAIMALLNTEMSALSILKSVYAGVTSTLTRNMEGETFQIALQNRLRDTLIYKLIAETSQRIRNTVIIAKQTAAQRLHNFTLAAAYNRLVAVASATWTYITAKLAYIKATALSTAANIAHTASLYAANTSMRGLIASAYAAATGLTIYSIASGLATAATLTLTAAYAAFSAVTGGLATALPTIALALIALVSAGAAAVGVLGNMSSATSGLGAALGVIKDALALIVDVYLTLAIAQWNVFITVIMGVIKAITSVVSSILGFFNILGPLQEGVDATINLFDNLVSAIMSIPDVIRDAFDAGANMIEDFINKMPDWLLEPLGISGEFSFAEPGQGMTVSRGDLSSGSEESSSAQDDMSGRQAPNFNYSEENVNEYATEVNADPEDEERLKRVVKDAMDEAESFSRRQQGGM